MYSKTIRGFPGRSCWATANRQIVREPAIVFRAHADGAKTKAEEARITIPKPVHILKVEHVSLDDGLDFGMLYSKRLARDRNDAAYFGRGDQPAEHAVPNHARCTE